MMLLSGCGRQVTGLGLANGGIVPSGQTLIRFETAGALNPQRYSYVIVFNTTGNGQQPYSLGYNSDFKDWSFFFQLGGAGNALSAPVLWQVYQDPANGSPKLFNIAYPTGTVNFLPTIPNANATNGFQITFNRCLLDRAPPTSTQLPPAPITNCPPYTYIATFWNISLFTIDNTNGQATPVDSLGTTGPNDTSYVFGIQTAYVVDTNKFKPVGGGSPQDASAQITGIEVFSTPQNIAVPAPSPTPHP